MGTSRCSTFATCTSSGRGATCALLFDRAASVRAQRIAKPAMIALEINALRFARIFFSFSCLIMDPRWRVSLILLNELPPRFALRLTLLPPEPGLCNRHSKHGPLNVQHGSKRVRSDLEERTISNRRERRVGFVIPRADSRNHDQ